MGFYGKAFDNGLQAKAAGSKPILFPANQNLGRSGRYRIKQVHRHAELLVTQSFQRPSYRKNALI